MCNYLETGGSGGDALVHWMPEAEQRLITKAGL